MDNRLALDDARKMASPARLSLILISSKLIWSRSVGRFSVDAIVDLDSSYRHGLSADIRRSSYPGPMKARTAFNKDMASASGDSSADEDVEHPSTAPAPDAEIAYSYDAHRGPSHGSQVLHHALEKAVERFETKETEKLVKNEYEVLDMDDDAPRAKRYVAPEDEEYEFVDA
jgi:hypothetical protein